MIPEPFIRIRFYISFKFFMILTMVLLGCTAAQHTADTDHAPVPLPVYRQGTTFVYADGTWETVHAVAPNIVTWKDHRGYTSNGEPDFTRRRIYYKTRTRQGTRKFGVREDLILKIKDFLWPLKIGNRTSYTETGTWID